MSSKRLLVRLAAVCASTFAFAMVVVSDVRAACPFGSSPIVIALRGSGEPMALADGTGNPGAPNSALIAELRRQAPAPFQVWAVPYPAVSVTDWRALLQWGGPSIEYRRSLRAGFTRLRQALRRARECNQRVALLGYSQGAQVIHRYRVYLERFYPNQNIAAVVLFGSPRFLGSTWTAADTGFSKKRSGIFLGSEWYKRIWGDRVLQFCNPIDVVCQGVTGPWSIAPHLDYEKYGTWAARFVRNRLFSAR